MIDHKIHCTEDEFTAELVSFTESVVVIQGRIQGGRAWEELRGKELREL